jgi:hypothetical protein
LAPFSSCFGGDFLFSFFDVVLSFQGLFKLLDFPEKFKLLHQGFSSNKLYVISLARMKNQRYSSHIAKFNVIAAKENSLRKNFGLLKKSVTP